MDWFGRGILFEWGFHSHDGAEMRVLCPAPQRKYLFEVESMGIYYILVCYDLF